MVATCDFKKTQQWWLEEQAFIVIGTQLVKKYIAAGHISWPLTLKDCLAVNSESLWC